MKNEQSKLIFLDIADKGLENLSGIFAFILSSAEKASSIGRFAAGNGLLVTAFFSICMGAAKLGASILKVKSEWAQDRKRDEANFFKKYHRTLVAAGIASAYMLMFTASILVSILVTAPLMAGGILLGIALASIVFDTLLEITDRLHNNRKIKQYNKNIEKNNQEIEILRAQSALLLQKMQANPGGPEELKTYAKASERIQSLLKENETHLHEIGKLQKVNQLQTFYIIASIMTGLTFALSFIGLFFIAGSAAALALGGSALTISLLACGISIYRALESKKLQKDASKNKKKLAETNAPQTFENNSVCKNTPPSNKSDESTAKDLKTSIDKLITLLTEATQTKRDLPTEQTPLIEAPAKVSALGRNDSRGNLNAKSFFGSQEPPKPLGDFDASSLERSATSDAAPSA